MAILEVIERKFMSYKDFMSAENVTQIRQRFLTHSKGISESILAREIGVAWLTICRFQEGGNVYSTTLCKIERWCEKMER